MLDKKTIQLLQWLPIGYLFSYKNKSYVKSSSTTAICYEDRKVITFDEKPREEIIKQIETDLTAKDYRKIGKLKQINF